MAFVSHSAVPSLSELRVERVRDRRSWVKAVAHRLTNSAGRSA